MEKTKLRKNTIIKTPKIDKSVFIAEGSQIIGDVILKPYSSIWYNTVLRGDINKISIGKRTNVQDNSVIHLENDRGVFVGDDVTIGHNVVLHGCTIGDGVLIGMGAIIMNGAQIGNGSVIGAGALIKQNMIIPKNSLVVGIPAKVTKDLSNDSYLENIKWAKKYVALAKIHKDHFSNP